MKLRLRTGIGDEGLVARLVGELESSGVTVRLDDGPTHEYALHYNPALSSDEVHTLMRALAPMRPAMIPSPGGVDGVDAELLLGHAGNWSDWNLKIHADSAAIQRRVTDLAGEFEFGASAPSLQLVERNRLDFGGAPAIYRHLLLWVLAREGIAVSESKRWGDSDADLWLYVRDPAHEDRRPAQCFTLELHVDDLDVGQELLGKCLDAGFAKTQLHFRELSGERPRFSIAGGPLSHERAAVDLARLRDLIGELLERERVDPRFFPLETDSGEGGIVARVTLPVLAHREQQLAPYAGGHPRSFQIQIQTDDPAAVEPLISRLRDEGFSEVDRLGLPETVCDFTIKLAGLAEHRDLAAALKTAVEECCAELGVDAVESVPGDGSDSPVVQISLPLAAHRDGGLRQRILSSAGSYNVKVRTGDPRLREQIVARLGELANFGSLRGDSEDYAGTPQVCFGGAPRPLIRLIAAELPYETSTVVLDKRWSPEDHDIWVDIPSSSDDDNATTLRETAVDVVVELDDWLMGRSADPDDEAPPAPATPAPLIAIGADELRIGDVVLARKTGDRHELAPEPGRFAHYCLDQRTAETLHHVATSVALREPCLLEGETSTSKTSSVLYVASLLNQPVVRLNLNGQTDTGELIGRYVPGADPDAREGAEEGSDDAAHPWRWQDGLIVQAMQRGWWVVLDEVNLAEPQILERLNSLLEREPSLILSEHDNSVYGAGGRSIHPDFRLFATMNPADYAGRSELSPAYRDRWLGYRYTPSPGEAEYRAMLQLLIHGAQPDILLHGRPYAGASGDAPLPGLAALDGLPAFAAALARFHAALEHASRRDGADGQGLGRHRRERYVFTRRSLIGLMEYTARAASTVTDRGAMDLLLRKGLLRYYIQRVAGGEDRKLVTQLLDAAGIGPTTWSYERPPGDTVVELTDAGVRPIAVIRLVRDALGCSLAEARDRVQGALPARVSLPRESAASEALVERFAELGATAEVVPADGDKTDTSDESA